MDKYLQYKTEFLSGNKKNCKEFFEKNKYYLESGYFYIIEDNLEKAQKCFEKLSDIDPRANWGIFLCQMLNQKPQRYPTYFEIKNFLEIDLNILIKYYKGDYIDKIIKYADFMANFNLEVYKYIGRVFWANDLMPISMFFLNRAKDRFYNDPELHYLLAYIYYNSNNLEQSKKYIQSCLSILPEYAPTVALKNKM